MGLELELYCTYWDAIKDALGAILRIHGKFHPHCCSSKAAVKNAEGAWISAPMGYIKSQMEFILLIVAIVFNAVHVLKFAHPPIVTSGTLVL